MPKPVIVDLLRHGETEGASWVFRGSTDVTLSARGQAQMQAVASALRDEPLTMVASSPMQRCSLMATSIADTHDVEYQVLQNMREMCFGDWEGNSASDVAEGDDGDLLAVFQQNPLGFKAPAGEAFDDFSQRVLNCWQQWLHDADDEHRLLVTHGGVMRVLLAHTLGMPMSMVWRLYVPHAAWCRISLLQGEQPRLLFMNRLP